MDFELYIDRIEQYETGALPATERAAFEADLAGNAELREALALYREANAVIEQGVEHNLRGQLKTWQAEAERPALTVVKTGGMRSTWVRLAAAASVALLLGWFGVRWAQGRYSDQALFAGRYEKPSDSSFRSGTAAERPLQRGFSAWTSGDLTGAATFFSAVSDTSEYYAEARYYLGHVALEQKKYPEAIAAFGQTAGRADSQFREKAEWNRVLAYLAAERTQDPAFKTYLAQIATDPGHSYQAQAKDLQQKLGAVWR